MTWGWTKSLDIIIFHNHSDDSISFNFSNKPPYYLSHWTDNLIDCFRNSYLDIVLNFTLKCDHHFTVMKVLKFCFCFFFANPSIALDFSQARHKFHDIGGDIEMRFHFLMLKYRAQPQGLHSSSRRLACHKFVLW